jgi:hypothetical protein
MSHSFCAAIVCIVSAALPTMAMAADEAVSIKPPPTAETPTEPSAPAATVVRAPVGPFGINPVDLKTLSRKRGGADTFNDMQLKGVVADNRAINVQTGSNAISEGAFAGTTGLPMVVQNTGSNVLIQNATIINVQVK